MTPQGVPTGEVWLPEVSPAGDWITQAACRGQDPNRWHPHRGDRITSAAAVAVCETCPVARDCLDYAVSNRIDYGIWGGLSERGRRPFARSAPQHRRPPPGHGAPGRYRYGCRCADCREAHRAEVARYRDAGRMTQATGHVQIDSHLWFVLLVVFILVGLRLLGVAL